MIFYPLHCRATECQSQVGSVEQLPLEQAGSGSESGWGLCKACCGCQEAGEPQSPSPGMVCGHLWTQHLGSSPASCSASVACKCSPSSAPEAPAQLLFLPHSFFFHSSLYCYYPWEMCRGLCDQGWRYNVPLCWVRMAEPEQKLYGFGSPSRKQGIA